MSEQIKKIAEHISTLDFCKHLPRDECNARHCFECEAEALYNAGYRKQSEGEWLENEDDFWVMCSECGTEFLDDQIGITNTYKYCPYCGAKMKGAKYERAD